MSRPHEVAAELAGIIEADLPWPNADYWQHETGANPWRTTKCSVIGEDRIRLSLDTNTDEARAVLRALATTRGGG